MPDNTPGQPVSGGSRSAKAVHSIAGLRLVVTTDSPMNASAGGQMTMPSLEDMNWISDKQVEPLSAMLSTDPRNPQDLRSQGRQFPFNLGMIKLQAKNDWRVAETAETESRPGGREESEVQRLIARAQQPKISN